MANQAVKYGELNASLDKAAAAWLKAHISDVLALYKDIHAYPELSGAECRTAAIVAKRFRDAGLAVTVGVGGHGVVGVLTSGRGPVILVRGDMDALPIEEETGLPYRSKVKGVMHACGHDIHTSGIAAVADIFAENRGLWRGTIVFVAQPSEELASGALDMISDGLFKRFPKPSMALALHVASDLAIGKIGYTSGWAAANVDSVDVTIIGKGGHGAEPHMAADPIVAAAYFITTLQTIVTRRIEPIQPAVITVGSIHAGKKHNIIPDKAVMQLTVRTYSDEVRAKVLGLIREVAVDTSRALGCSTPIVNPKVENIPAVYNDPDLTSHAAHIFGRIIAGKNVCTQPPTMGGEDFSVFSKVAGIPGLIYSVGAVKESAMRAARKSGGKSMISLHNSHFAPEAKPTLTLAIRSMCALAGSLLGKP